MVNYKFSDRLVSRIRSSRHFKRYVTCKKFAGLSVYFISTFTVELLYSLASISDLVGLTGLNLCQCTSIRFAKFCRQTNRSYDGNWLDKENFNSRVKPAD